MLSELLSLTILIAATSATLLICAEKWGWLDYYDFNRKEWMMERCMFCWGFWLGLFLIMSFMGIYLPAYYLLASLPAAAITRKLLQ